MFPLVIAAKDFTVKLLPADLRDTQYRLFSVFATTEQDDPAVSSYCRRIWLFAVTALLLTTTDPAGPTIAAKPAGADVVVASRE